MVKKTRLDQLLVTRGLCESREKAQRAIMAGDVAVAGLVVDKAGTRVADDAEIAVKAPDRYVGRGGFKLEAALDACAGRSDLALRGPAAGVPVLEHGDDLRRQLRPGVGRVGCARRR